MTTESLNPSPVDAHTLDVSGTPRTPFGRLVNVELRKSADTRAGRWLLIAIVAITAAIMIIFFAVADTSDRVYGNFAGIAATPQGFLLPVLGILLITSEWSQRTAMVTFALESSRSRVVSAKVVAAVIFGVAAFVVAVIFAALCTVLGGASNGFADVSLVVFALFLMLQVSTIIQGLAYGLILLNSPAAIVVFFVLPLAASIVVNLVSALKDAAPWIDLGTAQQPLFDATGNLSGDQWAHLGTATLIWIVVPFVAGLVRVMRAEVK